MSDKILVVDDSEVMRTMVKIFLSNQKLAVVEAENGARGFAEAKKHQPALIVTDFNMPVMDGLELARLVRADAELRRTLIIMLTDNKSPDLPIRAQETGINRLLAKSVGGPEVARAVAAFLREQQEQNARRAVPG
ncbi:MAG TPA: response regulator [Myxococcota bacterium]|nr:response regulator [Myxococcota bacterium]